LTIYEDKSDKSTRIVSQTEGAGAVCLMLNLNGFHSHLPRTGNN